MVNKKRHNIFARISQMGGYTGSMVFVQEVRKSWKYRDLGPFLKELACFPGLSLRESKTTFNFFAYICIFAVHEVQRNGSSCAKLENPHPALLFRCKHQSRALIKVQCSTPEQMEQGWKLCPAVQLSLSTLLGSPPSHPQPQQEPRPCAGA